MVYGNLGVTPPRLPEPPTDFARDPLITASYMGDLIRALEVFINQQQNSETEEQLETISWFMGR
jgi:hypothetical protein|tara:strand:+ start:483 stop:674 length:192 start_codon:yes stop_codon:yes gene_type:complete